MIGFVYLTTNKINGKKYIGMSRRTEVEDYFGSGRLIRLAIKKYGRENFSREILQECETFEELCEAEKEWINRYNAVHDPQFYNLANGGATPGTEFLREYWSTFTSEERRALRKWSRRCKLGELNPMHGKKHSEETRKKIGAKSVNRNWAKPNHTGAKNPKAKVTKVTWGSGEVEFYDCLLDFWKAKAQHIPYATLKSAAQRAKHFSKLDALVEYV
jgi:group I intron endonuclease